MASKNIIWQTVDHIKEEKSADWFWIVSIVAISISVLAIFFGNVLLALLILLATFTSFMLAHSAPRIVEYELTRKGVRVGEIVYSYSSLDSFYVIDEDGYDRDRILLKSKRIFMPIIVVPLGEGTDPEEVRDFLLEYLEEEEMYEPLSEHLMNMLGF
jgi:hypothetical protein